MTLPRPFQIFCLLLCVLTTASCGYVISSRPDGRSGPAERIFVEPIENQIAPPRPGLDLDFTDRLKEEMALDTRFELSGAASPDVTLRMSLIEFREPALVRSFDNKQTEVALEVGARIRVTTREGTREMRVTATDSYVPGLGEARSAGLSRLWRNLARNTLDQIADRDWVTPSE